MADAPNTAPAPTIRFDADPKTYRHWKLDVEGPVAWLVMKVDETAPLGSGYSLKLNSYDLGVDIELADVVERLRFEHPHVSTLVITSAFDRIFCAGANIYMLGVSSHPFKVNFCKFTNETRLGLEDLSRNSGCRTIAALNGTASGGGYELAIACDEIYLVDDGSSAVSLPEVPLLGVLPGTGGLTRLVDKRKVRRDLADVFSTVAEGVKGKRAKEMNLVDGVFPKSSFQAEVKKRAASVASAAGPRPGPQEGIELEPLDFQSAPDRMTGRFVDLSIDRARRVATLVVKGPSGPPPASPEALVREGSSAWALRAFRELDRVLLHLRMNESEVGVVLVKTEGRVEDVVAHDEALERLKGHWLARETILHQARVLRRMDATAKSFFALVEPGSCFAGSLLELALAGDRTYLLDDPKRPVALALSSANAGGRPMSHGLTRLQSRFLGDPARAQAALSAGREGPIGAARADELGLVTFRLDPLDWDDVRIAVEERASLSPDALTGMEASLRFGGPETCDSKIFGRLTAWQNWIFQRPNAVGERGALTSYGKPTRPSFDYRRT
jgi:benzoyl-CoA-dihydrodiol lyase